MICSPRAKGVLIGLWVLLGALVLCFPTLFAFQDGERLRVCLASATMSLCLSVAALFCLVCLSVCCICLSACRSVCLQ
jgi:hypothetical protein